MEGSGVLQGSGMRMSEGWDGGGGGGGGGGV